MRQPRFLFAVAAAVIAAAAFVMAIALLPSQILSFDPTGVEPALKLFMYSQASHWGLPDDNIQVLFPTGEVQYVTYTNSWGGVPLVRDFLSSRSSDSQYEDASETVLFESDVFSVLLSNYTGEGDLTDEDSILKTAEDNGAMNGTQSIGEEILAQSEAWQQSSYSSFNPSIAGGLLIAGVILLAVTVGMLTWVVCWHGHSSQLFIVILLLVALTSSIMLFGSAGYITHLLVNYVGLFEPYQSLFPDGNVYYEVPDPTFVGRSFATAGLSLIAVVLVGVILSQPSSPPEESPSWKACFGLNRLNREKDPQSPTPMSEPRVPDHLSISNPYNPSPEIEAAVQARALPEVCVSEPEEDRFAYNQRESRYSDVSQLSPVAYTPLHHDRSEQQFERVPL